MSLISADHQPHAAKKLIAGVPLFRMSYPGTSATETEKLCQCSKHR